VKKIVATAAGIGLLAGLAVFRPDILPWDAGWARGLGTGVLLGTAGSVGAFLVLVRNLKAGHGRFLAAVFGGMAVRMALFLVVLVLVLRGGSIPVTAFLAGLVPSYLGFQAAEMWYLHRTAGISIPAADVERGP
jgi:hypothetical protein